MSDEQHTAPTASAPSPGAAPPAPKETKERKRQHCPHGANCERLFVRGFCPDSHTKKDLTEAKKMPCPQGFRCVNLARKGTCALGHTEAQVARAKSVREANSTGRRKKSASKAPAAKAAESKEEQSAAEAAADKTEGTKPKPPRRPRKGGAAEGERQRCRSGKDCQFLKSSGACKFAHTPEELKEARDELRKKDCEHGAECKFLAKGFCYFNHTEEQMKAVLGRIPCKHAMDGKECGSLRGEGFCPYAHDDAEAAPEEAPTEA